jgi:hypothetical protein
VLFSTLAFPKLTAAWKPLGEIGSAGAPLVTVTAPNVTVARNPVGWMPCPIATVGVPKVTVAAKPVGVMF